MVDDVDGMEDVSEVVVRRAGPADLPAIAAIEAVSFPSPWSETLLAGELRQPDATYLVATINGAVVGFVGIWHVLDEGHICTLAVAPGWRGHGLGELLVLAAIERAMELDATQVYLEYRVGNNSAARLYEKLGFERTGIRRRYYSDTGEDAVLAQISGLGEPEGRRALERAWERWQRERGLRLVSE